MNLLERATAVVSASGGLDNAYFWLSNTELLVLRPAENPRHFTAVVVETAAGTETPLQAFNDRFGERLKCQEVHVSFQDAAGHCSAPEIHFDPPYRCSLSPDAAWLLWGSHSLDRARPGLRWSAGRLDGSDEKAWSGAAEGNSYGAWLSDGSGWVELVLEHSTDPRWNYVIPRAVVHSLNDAVADREVRITGLPDGLLLGMDHAGAVLLYRLAADDRRRRQASEPEMSEFRLDDETVAARAYQVPLPAGGQVMDVRLSPLGDRLAWVIGQPPGPDRRPRVYQLWFTDLRGSQAREGGQAEGIREPANAQGRTPYHWPRALRWTPDGGRVSCVYHNILYTVPAG